MLLFSVTFSSFAVADTILTQGFESGVMPPSGWTTINTNEDYPWTVIDKDTASELVHSGEWAAFIEYDIEKPSNNKLRTPSIDLDSYSSVQLEFWCITDTLFPGATMKLHVKGSGFDDVIWDLIEDENWDTFVYRQKTFDLSSYSGETITIEWQYVGINGELFALDDILITGITGNPPYVPSNPSPVDGETDISITPTISWTGGDPDGDPVKYDVYLGTENPPPKVANDISQESYEPDILYYETVYYWKIISQDNHGGTTPGPVWSFTTEIAPPNVPPYVPSNPNPENGEQNVFVFTELSWTGGDENPWDVVTYDVYLGLDSSPSMVANNISQASYDPGILEFNATYYWKIVAWDNHGAYSEGPLWNYTTRINLMGDTLHVGGTGPDNYSSIQAAVADAEEYDVVFVHEDSSPYYIENYLYLYSPIYLIGECAETTIIKCRIGRNIICLSSNNVTISNFTIEGGTYAISFSAYNSISNCLFSHLIFEGQYYENIRFTYYGEGNYTNIVVSYCTFQTGKELSVSTKVKDSVFYGNRFTDCLLSGGGDGNNISFFENEMTDVGLGIYGDNNRVYHNNIYSHDSSPFCCDTLFDDGYPSGGNYWAEYNGEDAFNGPNQDIPGPDNIIDEPYEFNDHHDFDYYPLKYPWGQLPPLARFTYEVTGTAMKQAKQSSPFQSYTEKRLSSCGAGEGATVLFNASESYDMDGKIISFEWDFDDGSPAGTGEITSHVFEESGTYNVSLLVTDNDGNTSLCWHYITIEVPNSPPSVPSIDGPSSGEAGESYDYTLVSTDPEEDEVYYYIQWGDGEETEWLGPFASGESYLHSHTWDEEGTYIIRAKAKDIHGHESDWGTLEVTMPVNYVPGILQGTYSQSIPKEVVLK